MATLTPTPARTLKQQLQQLGIKVSARTTPNGLGVRAVVKRGSYAAVTHHADTLREMGLRIELFGHCKPECEGNPETPADMISIQNVYLVRS